MSVTAGLTATKAALEIAKVVMDKLNTPSVDVHAVRASVQEMLIHVVNAQVALGDAQIEISHLRQELANRENLRTIEADMEFQSDGSYYVRKSDGAVCCPACWGDKQKTVPMAEIANKGYRCSIHKTVYRSHSSRAQQEADDNSFELIR